jgi:hypothetical protein
VDANKIVVHEVDRHHVRMVWAFLSERIGEPRHATVAYPDIQILPLRVAGRNVLAVATTFRRTVPKLGATIRVHVGQEKNSSSAAVVCLDFCEGMGE